MKPNHKTSKSQSGFMTLDFIFSLVLVMTMSVIFLVLGFTLSVVEVAQYIAFSSSRAYFAGHLDPQKQVDMGERKYNQLLETPGIGNLLKKKWFGLTFDSGNYADAYDADFDEKGNFTGVQLLFEAKVLEFSVPMLGSTGAGNSRGGFKTKINSFIGREPSSQECRQFLAKRWQLIQTVLNPSVAAENYQPIDDNGC